MSCQIPVQTEPPKVSKFIHPRVVIVLDEGHCGGDGGTVTGQSIEKDFNMKVVRLVAEQLRAERVRVGYWFLWGKLRATVFMVSRF